MNKGQRNQKGVTIVEILAALTLVSIVVVIAWTAMSIGFKHSAVETNKTVTQQDANLIISVLTSKHRTSDSYTVKIDSISKQLMIQSCTDDNGCGAFERVTQNDYSYDNTVIGGIVYDGTTAIEKTVEPKKQHLELTLTLDETVTVNTALTRLITN